MNSMYGHPLVIGVDPAEGKDRTVTSVIELNPNQEPQVITIDPADAIKVGEAARQQKPAQGHNSPKPSKTLHQLVPVAGTTHEGEKIKGYSGRMGAPIRRNDKCPCSSGAKYKHCHGKRKG